MAKDALIQVRIDEDLKNQVEALYKSLGTTFSEVVRMLAVQSLEVQGIPFEVKTGIRPHRNLIARGSVHKYADPSKIPFEKDAWKQAAVRKHADN